MQIKPNISITPDASHSDSTNNCANGEEMELTGYSSPHQVTQHHQASFHGVEKTHNIRMSVRAWTKSCTRTAFTAKYVWGN